MKLNRGIGINDTDYQISKYEKVGVNKWKQVWLCPFYNRWDKLMERLGPNNPHQSYDNKSCCDDWIYLSKFKAWMESQIWEGLDLDKDILISGNTVYSPETCAFVPPWLNTLILINSGRKGIYPLGVNYNKESKKYRAQVSNFYTNTNLHLGLFECEKEAHKAWQIGKAEQILNAVTKYKEEICFREDIEYALLERVDKLKLQASLGEETTFL